MQPFLSFSIAKHTLQFINLCLCGTINLPYRFHLLFVTRLSNYVTSPLDVIVAYIAFIFSSCGRCFRYCYIFTNCIIKLCYVSLYFLRDVGSFYVYKNMWSLNVQKLIYWLRKTRQHLVLRDSICKSFISLYFSIISANNANEMNKKTNLRNKISILPYTVLKESSASIFNLKCPFIINNCSVINVHLSTAVSI